MEVIYGEKGMIARINRQLSQKNTNDNAQIMKSAGEKNNVVLKNVILKGVRLKGVILKIIKTSMIFYLVLSSVLLMNNISGHYIISAADDYTQRNPLHLYIISPYSIKLEWRDNISYETGYIIQRSTDSADFKSIASVRANSTTYIDYSVSPGHVYAYRILYKNMHGNLHQYTVEASTSSELISKPNALELISVSHGQIELKWAYPGYKQYDTIIERKAGNDKDSEWKVIYRAPAGTFNYIDQGLVSGVRYYYRIKAATDSNIFSDYYPSIHGKTIYTFLKAPQNLHGYAVSSTKIYLSWEYESDEEKSSSENNKDNNKDNKKKDVDYYELERRTENEDFVTIAIIPYTNKWYQDSGLTTGKLYTYRVRAKKNSIYSDYSDEVIINCGYINPPVALSARAISGTSIELKWENRGLDVGAQIEVWRKSEDYQQWDLFTVLDRNYSKFVDNNVEEGKKYSYRLRSVISYNNTYSNYSNEVSAYARDYNAPSDIDYTVIGKDRIQLYWKYEDDVSISENADNKSDLNNKSGLNNSHKFRNGFIIEMKEGLFGQWKELAQVPSTADNYFVRGLDENKTYYFKVRAVNDNAGVGAYSKEIKVITRIPKTPEIISIEPLSPSKIKLKWQRTLEHEPDTGNTDSGYISGYIIERKLNALNHYKVIAVLLPGTDTYIDTDLSSSRRYDYRIKAFNKAGNSPYSRNAFAVTKTINYFDNISSSHPASKAIYDLAGRGVIKGQKSLDHEGNVVEMFYPNEAVTRAEFVYMLVRAFKLEGKAVGSFADVTYGDWFYNEIMIAKNLGLVEGDELNYFYPEKFLTQGEMQSIINKVLKTQGRNLIYEFNYKNETNRITDTKVIEDQTDISAVNKDEIVTRGEAVVVIYNIIDFE
jgi:hypothetical protein